ncbi:hypothetical protein KY284_001102 [Solanum tuberosum]|nr:hypothetical protein KY284_001102 [Solanum tuberosum]
MKRDSQGKTQNYGVTLSATTNSFSSARDQNPIDGEVVYYGVIQDIIEIDYWEEENCPNIGDTFFGEPDNDIGPSNGIPDVHVDLRWSREDVLGDAIDMPTHDQHSEYMEEDMDTSKVGEDFDDVDWDWIVADD